MYKSIFVPATIVTAIVAKLYVATGMDGITFLSWFKLFTTAVIIYFTHYRYRNLYYYYQNLGISRKALIISAVCIDILLYAITIYLVHHAYHTFSTP